MKPAILTDTTKCNGCHECVAACKKQNHLSADVPRRWDRDDGLSARNWTSIVEGPQHAFVRKQCRLVLRHARSARFTKVKAGWSSTTALNVWGAATA